MKGTQWLFGKRRVSTKLYKKKDFETIPCFVISSITHLKKHFMAFDIKYN